MKSLLTVLLLALSTEALACVDLPFTANLDFDSAATYNCVDKMSQEKWSVYFDDQTIDLDSANRNLVERNRSDVKVFNFFQYLNVRSNERLVSHYNVNFFTSDNNNHPTLYSRQLNFLASKSGVWFQPASPQPDYRVGACYYNRVSLYGFSQANQASPSYAMHFEFSPDYKSMVFVNERAGNGVTVRLNCSLAKDL